MLRCGLTVTHVRRWHAHHHTAVVDELATLRRSVVRAAPYGDDAWQVQTATALGLESSMRFPRPTEEAAEKKET